MLSSDECYSELAYNMVSAKACSVRCMVGRALSVVGKSFWGDLFSAGCQSQLGGHGQNNHHIQLRFLSCEAIGSLGCFLALAIC